MTSLDKIKVHHQQPIQTHLLFEATQRAMYETLSCSWNFSNFIANRRKSNQKSLPIAELNKRHLALSSAISI